MNYNYNIWFNVCAIVMIACSIVLYLLRKNVRIVQTKSFFSIMIIMFFASVFSLFTIVLEGVTYTGVLISNYAVILCDTTVASLWIIYILSISTRKTNIRLAAFTILVPSVICLTLLVANGIWGILFTVNRETKVYEGGQFMFMLYLLVYLHFIIVAFNVYMSNRKFISRERILFMPIILIEGIAGAVVEIVFPTMVVQQFALSLMTMTTFLSLQNPNEYFDEESGLLNKIAFNASYGKFLSDENQPKSFIAICIHDIDAVLTHINEERKDYLEKNVLSEISPFKGISSVFKFEEGKYLIAVNTNNNMQTLDLYALSLRTMAKINIASTCCLFETPKHATSLQGIIQLMEKVVQKGIALNVATISPDDLNLHKESYIKTVEDLVRTCIRENRLEVFYQPIYSVKENRFVSAEAVVRMKNGKEGILAPNVFIPLAEKDGNILDIGYFVLDDVCKTIAEYGLENFGINTIQVNLSVVECIQDDLVSKISQILKKYNVNPRVLNLQITEAATTYFSDVVKRNIRQLHNMGITFSLDGFGSGYSSLNKIINLPLSIIKLDRSIVIPAFKAGNESAQVLLNCSVDMVKEIGCKIVASGAETDSIAKGLAELGCDYIQGYYYAHPMPRQKFLKFITR